MTRSLIRRGGAAPLARARGFAARLRDCSSGLALTEFAFSLPILLSLGLGGLETANYAMAHLRVSNIAMMTADSAARVRETIDEADVIELMTGAKMTGDRIEFAEHGRIVLSSLEFDGSTQWIRWQRCDGALNVDPAYGTPMTEDGVAIDDATEIFASDRATASPDPSSPEGSEIDGMGEEDNRIVADGGTAVMMVEVTYDYQPIIPSSFLDGVQIRYQSSFNVRQRTDQMLRNAAALEPKRCDVFQA